MRMCRCLRGQREDEVVLAAARAWAKHGRTQFTPDPHRTSIAPQTKSYGILSPCIISAVDIDVCLEIELGAERQSWLL
jgi:hypothetical protein